MRRLRAVDVAKGLVIAGIVLGHVLRGLKAAHVITPFDGWFYELDADLYVVRLPSLLFLSGLFLVQGVRRRGAAPFLRRRLALLGWVFLVWSVIQGLVELATAPLANQPLPLTDALLAFVRPLGPLWFLPALMLFTVLGVLLVGRSRGRVVAGMLAALCLSAATWGLQGVWVGTQGWSLLLFFLLGTLVGAPRVADFLHSRASLVIGGLCAVGFAALVALGDPTPPTEMVLARTPATVALGLLAAPLGVAALMAVSALLARTPVAGALAYVGRRSMQIYVAHTIFTAGTRIVLMHAGVTSVAVLATGAFVMGVAGPLVVALVADRLGIWWLYDVPTRRHGPVEVPRPREESTAGIGARHRAGRVHWWAQLSA